MQPIATQPLYVIVREKVSIDWACSVHVCDRVCDVCAKSFSSVVCTLYNDVWWTCFIAFLIVFWFILFWIMPCIVCIHVCSIRYACRVVYVPFAHIVLFHFIYCLFVCMCVLDQILLRWYLAQDKKHIPR